jgi:hypothetical protein
VAKNTPKKSSVKLQPTFSRHRYNIRNADFSGAIMMRKKISLFVCGLAAIFLALGYGQRDGEFKIVEENGILTAMNPAHPVPLPDSPKDIVFSEEFQIGALEGDPDYIFGEFISFAIDDEENVYVLDWRGKTVRKFDAQGKFLFSFGGPGQGPGEFSDPQEIRYLSDGHLMVFEAESQKFSSFTTQGKVARTGRFQKLMYPPYFGLTNGGIIAMNVQHDTDQTLYILGVFDDKSELMKPLHRIERKPDPPWPRGSDADMRARRFAQLFSKVAFRPESVLALNGKEDLYFAFTDSNEIKIFDTDGELKRKIRTELPFLPVEKRDRQEFLEYHLPRDISTWSTMEKALQNKIKSLIEFPKEKPAFLSLIPMDEDYLMVVRDGSYRQNALIDIFDPSGRLIMEKKLNLCIKGGICKDNKLYTIYEDDDGNQYVKCFRYKLLK